jgi:drug/metabolite transporter (DMT)-like permease
LSRPLAYAAVAFAACSWGTWALVLRRTEAIGPMPTALESAIVMGVITLLAAATSLRDRIVRRAGWRARAWVAFLGVADALNVLFFFAAYKLTITVAILAHYLAPIFVAVAAPIVLKERITARTLIAVVASFGGLAVMLVPHGGVSGAAVAWRSAAFGAASAVFYASNVIVNKFIVDEFSTSETMFWHGLVATPLLAAFVPPAAWAAVDARAAGFLAVATIVPGALAGLAFVWGLRRMPAAHASTLTLLEPLVAVLVGAAVFGEALGGRALMGGVLILGGAFLVMTQRAPREGSGARDPAQ